MSVETGYPPEVEPSIITPEEAVRDLDKKIGEYAVSIYLPDKQRVERTGGLDAELNSKFETVEDYMNELLEERFTLNVVLGTAREETITPQPVEVLEATEPTQVRFQLSSEPIPEERSHWTVLIDHYDEVQDERQW